MESQEIKTITEKESSVNDEEVINSKTLKRIINDCLGALCPSTKKDIEKLSDSLFQTNKNINEAKESISKINSQVEGLSAQLDRILKALNYKVQREVQKEEEMNLELERCLRNICDVVRSVYKTIYDIAKKNNKSVEEKFVSMVSDYFYRVLLNNPISEDSLINESDTLGIKTIIDDIQQSTLIRDRIVQIINEEGLKKMIINPKEGDDYDCNVHEEVFSSLLETGDKEGKKIKNTIFLGIYYGESYASIKSKVKCK